MAKWSGWWEQRGFGRQEMRNLVLDVDPAGETSGSGDDHVGSFTITGTISAEVVLVKQYVGQHSLRLCRHQFWRGYFRHLASPRSSWDPRTDLWKVCPVPDAGFIFRPRRCRRVKDRWLPMKGDATGGFHKLTTTRYDAMTTPRMARMTPTTTASIAVRGI